MTEKTITKWQLGRRAGVGGTPSPITDLGRFILLGDVEGGPVGRAVAAPQWLVPEVSLVDREFRDPPCRGEIDPDVSPPLLAKKCLSWRFRDDDGHPVARLVKANKTRGLLAGFILLREASDETIRAFASELGVLGLCCCASPRSPREPFTHRRYEITRPLLVLERRGGCAPATIEPLDSWKALAVRADRLLRLATSLRERQVKGGAQWRKVMTGVNWWLERSGAYPYCYRPARTTPGLSGWRVGLDCQTLFDFIAVQLMDAVFHADLLVVCSNCGELFRPNKKPTAGTLSFCDRDQCGIRASWRFAQRRRRNKTK